MADYIPIASALFANVRLPASILAGALVPLGFGFALPAEGPAFSSITRRSFIRLHRIVAVVAYSCLLICIVYSSVSINALAESPHEKAESVLELIHNEYELAWVMTNVTFFIGLCGALVLVSLRVLLMWEKDEGRVATGFCAAALLLMVGIFDEQVQAGGYAPDLLRLIGHLVQMSVERAASTHSPWLCAALASWVGATAAAGQLLVSTPSEANGSKRPRGFGQGRAAGELTTSQVDTVVSSVSDTGTTVEAAAADATDAIDAAAADAPSAGGADA